MAEATEKVDSTESDDGDGNGGGGETEEAVVDEEIAAEVGGSRTGTIYRGKSGMWMFYIHRITGISILAFLLIHIADVAAVGWGREAYNTIHRLYETLFFRLMEVGLLGALLFHALNGLRVIIIDFWDRGADYQKQLSAAVAIAFVALFGTGATVMLIHYFSP